AVQFVRTIVMKPYLYLSVFLVPFLGAHPMGNFRGNYPGRAGGKEIAVVAGQDATIQLAAQVSPEQPGQTGPGTVVRGDFLSRLLHQGEIPFSMMLIGL